MNISSRMVKMEMLSPLVKILGEDVRALRAKVTALRNTAVKGLKNYRATLEQVGGLTVSSISLGYGKLVEFGLGAKKSLLKVY